MDTDFVSEVDRKFFQNNMLSNEDWEASMELTDIMGLDSNSIDFLSDFNTDLQIPEPDNVEDDFFKTNKTTHDDLLNDWSDSSDSGISGLQSPPDSLVKSEPMSPSALSHHSDSCDSAISQLTDFGAYASRISQTEPSQDSLSQEVTLDTLVTSPVSTIDLTTTIKTELPSQPPTSIITNILPSSGSHVQIDSILNSKIKIKPKPENSSNPPSPKKARTLVQEPTPQKSLVLTEEEFQRLTSQGVLRFQPPKQESIPSTPVLPTINTICTQSLIPVKPATNGLNIDDKDTKAFKRQQRMIKNRESASLSRKRKKEYMSSLEWKLKEYCDENERLKQENQSLRVQLSELHSENECLKKSFSVSPTLKKTIVLAAFFLFFTLNLGSWSSVLMSSQPETRGPILSVPSIHKGRQLMSVLHKEGQQDWSVEKTVNEVHDFLMQYGDQKSNVTDIPPICPTYFNRTESLRLAEQLAGWMYRHEEEKKKVVKKQDKRQKEKQLRPISTLRRAMRGDLQHDVNRQYQRQIDAQYELQLYEGANTGKDFLKALHRRNDTFYVLSFDEDYYLVPAVYHNKTSRPRMSLVMPAIALNESMMPSEDQVGMMQIDCEVMNTQLIHVRKSAIPKYVREKHNATFTKFGKNDKFYT